MKQRLLAILFGMLFFSNPSFAVDVPVTFDSGDDVIDLDVLMPLSRGNSWTYNLSKGSSPLSQTANAVIGEREPIGGGCLTLEPVEFGDDFSLYIGNYGSSLTIHGIYLKNWLGLSDVQLKFETRERAFWDDFFNRHEGPDALTTSCQNTGFGRTERAGLVLLENLSSEFLYGSVTNAGQIICATKNYDLIFAPPYDIDNEVPINGAQNGSGFAVVNGGDRPLDWRATSVTRTRVDANTVNLVVNFVANIQKVDYPLVLDITMVLGTGITAVSVTGDGENDLFYTSGTANLVSATTNLRPAGSCPEDGNIGLLFLAFITSFALFRKYKKI